MKKSLYIVMAFAALPSFIRTLERPEKRNYTHGNRRRREAIGVYQDVVTYTFRDPNSGVKTIAKRRVLFNNPDLGIEEEEKIEYAALEKSPQGATTKLSSPKRVFYAEQLKWQAEKKRQEKGSCPVS